MGWNCFMNILIFFLSLLLVFCVYGWWKQMRFKNTPVKYVTPTIPIFGNNIKMLFGRENMTTFVTRMYNYYPDQKYIGMFQGIKPVLMLRDIELIKKIGVKDFDHFHDHMSLIDDQGDDLFGKTLFNLKGNKWREMRAALSPAFSSSKMKNMFIYIEQCAKNMSDFYLNEIDRQGKDVIDVEAKDTFSKYTLDTIATSAFGIEIDSLSDSNNEFYKMGNLVANFSKFQVLKLLIIIFIPKFAKMINLKLGSSEITAFFTNLVQSSMKNREENNIIRHDMIHLLMQAKNGSLIHEKVQERDMCDTGFATVEESTLGKKTSKMEWTDQYLVAQAIIFFAAGFDTTASVLAFFFYEISRDPEIQQKLYKEIEEHNRNSDDKFVYYDIQKLKYLDMCVSETLRLWPPAAVIDRVCDKTYNLPPPSDVSDVTFELKENELIFLPIYALHHDPKLFSNPERFDPERFSDENKHNIQPGSYIPFGVGPRNCIASRYALMVVKAVIFHILSKLEVVVTNKSDIPLQLSQNPFNMRAKNGIWVGFKKRST